MTATFGEFLNPATEHITAAVSYQGDLPDAAMPGIIRQLDRMTTALAHYLRDIAPPDWQVNGPAHQPDSSARAAVEARTALRRAAHCLRHAAITLPDTGSDTAHPVVSHLATAADNLAAGRDVLQSHFARGPFGGWEGTSYWAPAITSRPVTIALTSELAGHARTLAPWAARLSLSRRMGAGAPAPACLDLHAATRWLWVAGATLEEDLRQHPPSTHGRRLLAAVPGNFPPAGRHPASGESVPDLCHGITATAERLRHAALAFTSHARLSPAATSTTWRKNALAAAITGHASQITLHTLSERASELGLDPAIASGLQAASQQLRATWKAWRATAHQWDIISTGRYRTMHTAPAGANFSDLALQAARLAYRDPQWTAAFTSNGPIRAPATLAPTEQDLTAVLAAVHHAIDAITRAGTEDQDAIHAASGSGHLYLPTRLMPEECNIPRPYAPAPPSRVTELLASYSKAITASTRAAIALDGLAVALDVPTWTLAALRVPTRLRGGSPETRSHDVQAGHWHAARPQRRAQLPGQSR